MANSASRSHAVRAPALGYRRLFSAPGTRGFFAAASLARLGVAMTALGLLWTVESATGSFAIAGVATGALALAEAVVGPQVARTFDRWGQTRVLPVVVLAHVSAVIATVVACSGHLVPAILVASAAVGATIPQPGALSAARWVHALGDRRRMPAAFALEASVNDVVFLCGPPSVTVLATAFASWAGLAAATTCLAAGCLALAGQRGSAPPVRPPHADEAPRRRRLISWGFASVFGVNLGLGCFFGTLPVVLTAAASAQGWAPLTGVVLAITSVASLVTGLLFGSMARTPPARVVQLIGGLGLVGAVAVAAAAPILPVLIPALALGGAAIAPLIVTSGQLVQRVVGPASLTQGFTWINTASAAGIAGAAAISGATVDASGPSAALGVACALVAIAPASSLLAWSRRTDADG